VHWPTNYFQLPSEVATSKSYRVFMKIKGNSIMNVGNFSLKTTILVALCLQNAGYTLLRKYTTQNENVSAREILIVSEIIKLGFSIYMLLKETELDKSDAQGTGFNRLSWLILHSGKMLVLAAIYGAMNILSFVALHYIGAGEFTICAQLKILTTAGFAVMILGTSLSFTKWRALALLVLGCILVASPSFTQSKSDSADKGLLQLFGYGAVLTEVVLSGFASIYFEKVVKSTTEVITIWERNFQLGFYSIIIYGGIIVYENFNLEVGVDRLAWSSWSVLTILVSILGAAGGLLVAATLKYADSILKTLAAAGAIVLSTMLGHYCLGGPLDMIVSIGALVSILSIANYTLDATLN
jgi:UDP-sugar transporter A1/2/3